MAKKKRKAKLTIKDNKIKYYLDKQGMSQIELADICKTDKSHISLIILGERPSLSLPMAMRIAKALGQTVEEVFILD